MSNHKQWKIFFSSGRSQMYIFIYLTLFLVYVIYNRFNNMGKKMKKQLQEAAGVEEEVEQVQEEKEHKKKPLEKYLPHNKYIAKQTKLHLRKKKEAIEFIHIDKNLVNSALKQLKAFVEKTKNVKDIFQSSNDGFIYLEVDLAQVPEHHSVRPIQIPLPFPIYSQKYNSRMALFTCEPQQPFLDLIQDLQLPFLSETINYDRAKKHFRNNTQKMKILNANDLFFCDWKIYNLLRKCLGKLFYEKKKYPFAVDCEGVPENLKQQYSTYEEYLNGLMNSTYTMLGNGPVYTLKVGRLNMPNSELVKNIMHGCYRFLPYILEGVGVDQVRQISIKGYNSPSLPIYNHIDPKELQIYLKLKDSLKEEKEQK